NIKITFLPLKFILASGYAASEQNNTLKTTVNIVTTTLLNKYLQKGKVSITLTKFIKVIFSVINLCGYRKIFSPADFNDVEISQRNGHNINNVNKISNE